MARLTITLELAENRGRPDLMLDITYSSFRHGWVWYEILAAVGGQSLLNGAAP